MAKRKGFFAQEVRPEDELARQHDVEALIAPRRLVAQDIPVDRVRPNPFQPRRNFEGIEELSQAIRAQGFTTRLRVRPDPVEQGYFQLVFGERRLRAAKVAAKTVVPCEIADHSDEEMLEIGLAENIQRQDLKPLEEAHAFQLMIDHHGYSVRKLAERIGKDKSYVEDRLKVLRSPGDVQTMIAVRPDTLRVARELSKLETAEERQPLIDAAVAGSLVTKDIREIVQIVVQQPDAGPAQIQEHVTARIEQRAADTVQHRPAPDVHRAMERNIQALRTVLSRLRQLLPVLDAADRAVLTTNVAELHKELDGLIASLPHTPRKRS